MATSTPKLLQGRYESYNFHGHAFTVEQDRTYPHLYRVWDGGASKKFAIDDFIGTVGVYNTRKSIAWPTLSVEQRFTTKQAAIRHVILFHLSHKSS